MARTQQDSGMLEEVIGIYFHTKVTKGGRNLSVAALVAVGDGQGKVGLGYGKASGVPMAIEKAGKEARSRMTRINLIGDTIAHETTGRHGAARVLLIPASPGTGVKAGGTVRSIMTVAGVHNLLSKIYGNANPINVAKATMAALNGLMSLDEVKELRGVDVKLFHPQADEDGNPIVREKRVAEPAAAEGEPATAEATESATATAVAEQPAEEGVEPEAAEPEAVEPEAAPAEEPEAAAEPQADEQPEEDASEPDEATDDEEKAGD
jgi:small subunit ribosomal protein S5